MAYLVFFDTNKAGDPTRPSLSLIEPTLTVEENKAGTFTFRLALDHPYYSLVKERKTQVTVFLNDTDSAPIWAGHIVKVEQDFWMNKSVECEGDLACLSETIQRQHYYSGVTSQSLLTSFITNHNAQSDVKFTVGSVTAKDSNDYISCYTNYDDTWSQIKDDLLDDIGGYLRIRYSGYSVSNGVLTVGTRYLDYLADDARPTTVQSVEIGKNLLDISIGLEAEDIATVVIPLGKKLEESERTSSAVNGLEEYLTIKSVNNGLDYLESSEAISNYGRIWAVAENSDITTASGLKTYGQKYLSSIQFSNMVIDATAIDLSITGEALTAIELSSLCVTKSAPHGLDSTLVVSKKVYVLNEPDKNRITLGRTSSVRITDKILGIANNSKLAMVGGTNTGSGSGGSGENPSVPDTPVLTSEPFDSASAKCTSITVSGTTTKSMQFTVTGDMISGTSASDWTCETIYRTSNTSDSFTTYASITPSITGNMLQCTVVISANTGRYWGVRLTKGSFSVVIALSKLPGGYSANSTYLCNFDSDLGRYEV